MARKRAVLERANADPAFVDELLGPATKKKTPAEILRSSMARAGSFGTTPTQEDIAAGREANIPALTLGSMIAGPALAAGVAAPVATAKGLALGAAGASAGGYAGKAFGQGLEHVGAPEGTSEVAGTVGGLAGGLAGPMGGPRVIGRILQAGGGKTGLVGRLLGGGEASTPEAVALAAKKLELEAAKLAEKKAAREATLAYRSQMAKNAEERIALMRARLESKGAKAAATAPRVAAKPPAANPAASGTPPAATVAPAPDTAQIVLKLQQQMGTAAGRKVVRELLQQMPKAQASQIRLLLARGQEHPATVLGALFNPAAPARTAGKPGEELARMLGQIQ